MATLDQLNTWLSEAESARHSLAMGQSVVEVWRDGRRISYGKQDMASLQKYIDWLNSQIAQANATANGCRGRRALSFRWRD